MILAGCPCFPHPIDPLEKKVPIQPLSVAFQLAAGLLCELHHSTAFDLIFGKTFLLLDSIVFFVIQKIFSKL